MIISKVTVGFVIQRFNSVTGNLIDQEFVAGESTYENEAGEEIEMPDCEVEFPFKMAQPD